MRHSHPNRRGGSPRRARESLALPGKLAPAPRIPVRCSMPVEVILWQKQASAAWWQRTKRASQKTRRGQPRAHHATGSSAASCPGDLPPPHNSRGIASARFGGSREMLPRELARTCQSHPPSANSRRPPPGDRERAALLEVERQTQLIIPAAGAFGTGEHATTAMSLRLLEEADATMPRWAGVCSTPAPAPEFSRSPRGVSARRGSRYRQRSARCRARPPERAPESNFARPISLPPIFCAGSLARVTTSSPRTCSANC